MDRRMTSMAVLLLTACSAAAPEALSMCNLPRSLGGWQGASVRWHGVLLDATPHGMSLVAIDCQRRGIPIRTIPNVPKVEAALRRGWRERGVIEVDLTGKITADRDLIVTAVHSVVFRRMSDDQVKAFWTSKGF
jgi:hypothetical protein